MRKNLWLLIHKPSGKVITSSMSKNKLERLKSNFKNSLANDYKIIKRSANG